MFAAASMLAFPMTTATAVFPPAAVPAAVMISPVSLPLTVRDVALSNINSPIVSRHLINRTRYHPA
jgi:hypothetical protein